jgi:hypothetical protein
MTFLTVLMILNMPRQDSTEMAFSGLTQQTSTRWRMARPDSTTVRVRRMTTARVRRRCEVEVATGQARMTRAPAAPRREEDDNTAEDGRQDVQHGDSGEGGVMAQRAAFAMLRRCIPAR